MLAGRSHIMVGAIQRLAACGYPQPGSILWRNRQNFADAGVRNFGSIDSFT